MEELFRYANPFGDMSVKRYLIGKTDTWGARAGEVNGRSAV
jgi:hypothetical protein